MSSQDNSGKEGETSLGNRISKFRLLSILDLVIEFKGAVTVIIAWLVVAELAGYSAISTIISIIKLMLYPLNLLLFNTDFSTINVPEVFILMIPLVIFVLSGFLIIISTED